MSSRAADSTLTTSAPSDARIMPAKGPAAWTEKSATRTPERGAGGVVILLVSLLVSMTIIVAVFPPSP